MNVNQRWQDARSIKLVDELLVDTAIKIQLSPTLHGKAVGHSEAVHSYIERDGSPLHGHVAKFYPQGSMAIGTTIRSRDEDDLFDIDLVAELTYPAGSPCEALDILHEAIEGKPGSKYYGRVERQTRCVTVNYTDMHLDVTPLYRDFSLPERGGAICHANPEEPIHHHTMVAANPWGFGRWFNEQTPADQWFREMILRKSLTEGRSASIAADAEAEPVPDHEHVFAKPMAVIALQLVKRWVQINHDRRGGQGRRPPSVVLSRSFGEHAGHTSSLVEEIIYQVEQLRAQLDYSTAMGRLIDLRNPTLPTDHLTDRWPGSLAVQRQFAEDLGDLVTSLKLAVETDKIETLQAILGRLFGERATADAVRSFYERAGRAVSGGQSKVLLSSGTALAGISLSAATRAAASPSHRFYGDEE